MIQVFKIQIPNRKKFGGAFQQDFVLPSRMCKITGVAVNVLPGYYSRFKRENNTIKSVQVGTVSVSVNNTDVVFSSVPAMCLAKLPSNNALTQNTTKLLTPYTLRSGSQMRIILEETLLTPFVKAKDPYFEDYFHPDDTPTNSYQIKVYIHYNV